MPIDTAIWKVGSKPERLTRTELPSEQILEEMIVEDPGVLMDDLMIIGRQIVTAHGGKIDLLALQPDASLIIIELKRDKTPRHVVAQSLDYASWVQGLNAADIVDIYQHFRPGGDLAPDFQKRFGVTLAEEDLNASHQLVIVGSSLDASTERIVKYLSDRGFPINALFFQVFRLGGELLLSRTWLLDPVAAQQASGSKPNTPGEPWNGEFYVSYGDSLSRSWEDARRYGFISAGGGAWYSRTLNLLAPGDRVWVNIPSVGYVGVGRVTGYAQRANDFTVQHEGVDTPVLSVVQGGTYHDDQRNDPERSEYFVPVRWLQTVAVASAFKEVGLFGNQNTVAKPTTPKWRHTVERLKERFPFYDGTQEDPHSVSSSTRKESL